ncbi:response regulator transcription factor [Merismopedia glauca]|uniref:DNA-binding response regulator n=1 Tax=Merismopedia glauca CCAP 1448/3 TaxID=1296344 RepID=A0A2T1BZ28_9CYAN|nr:response regulator transcription factor [Merismopedia glauca]PSB01204.1 DNA-binding response regulator [Merismopedia glauca CCAP 1448/3]
MPNTPEPIRILLVEDDELFRLGLSVRLAQEPTLQIVAEASDGESAIDLACSLPLDIAILDVVLPGIAGVEACRKIKQKRPNLPILILTSHSSTNLIAQLIEAKAQGYCLKGIAAENLILAIRSVAGGASWWDAVATQEIQAAFTPKAIKFSSNSSALSHNPLTKREQEIISLIAAGKSNQEVADILYITTGTVRVHMHAILQKLDVKDRTQAVILALQKGWIDKNL